MIRYSNPIRSDNGIIYSCDMVRLSFSVPKFRYITLRDVFNNMQYSWNFIADYYGAAHFKIGKFRDMFACSRDDFRFTVGLGLITANNNNDSVKCFLEFNPNKCDMDFMKEIMSFFCSYMGGKHNNKYFDLVRWDLAIDIPVERSKAFLVKKGKREYSKHISSSVTEYVGSRNTNGFSKLYDKSKESELDYPLTRLEVTCDSLVEFKFPEVYLIHHDIYTDEGLSSTDKVIVKLLRQCDSETQIQLLSEMGRAKKKKLKEYIFPVDTKFKIDMNAVSWVAMEVERMLYLWKTEDFVEVEKENVENEDCKQLALFSE